MGCCCFKPLDYPPDLPPGQQIQVYESVVAGPLFVVIHEGCERVEGTATLMITKEGLFYYRSRTRLLTITYDMITGITVKGHFSYRKSGFQYFGPCGCRGCYNACGINSFINIDCMFKNAPTTMSIGVIDGEDLAQQINKLCESTTF